MKKYTSLFTVAFFFVSFVFFSFGRQRTNEGIGDVRYSVLKPQIFERLNPGWKHMAGQAMQRNWQLYHLFEEENLLNDPDYALTINNLPDGRGVFIRGMNSNRSTDSGDAKGDRPVGQFQIDGFKSHDHAYTDTWQNDEISDDADDRGVASREETSATRRTSSEGDGTETRPRNITLYIYIKVY